MITFCKVGLNYPPSPSCLTFFCSSPGHRVVLQRVPALPLQQHRLFVSSPFTPPSRPESRGSVAPPGPQLDLECVTVIRPSSLELNDGHPLHSVPPPLHCPPTGLHLNIVILRAPRLESKRVTCRRRLVGVCVSAPEHSHMFKMCAYSVCAPLQESKHIVDGSYQITDGNWKTVLPNPLIC